MKKSSGRSPTRERGFDRGRFGDIARVRLGGWQFGGELGGKLRAPRHQRDGVPVIGETPRERLAIAGTDADHCAHRTFASVRHR